MAKINGLEIKEVKHFLGHEQEDCFQGNLYLNGKKIATWSNSYSMGENDYNFEPGYSRKKLDELIKKMYPETKYSLGYDLDLIIDDLLELREYEKSYKRQLKNVEAPVLAVVCRKYIFSTPYHFSGLASWYYNYTKDVKQKTDEIMEEEVMDAAKRDGVAINEENAAVTIFRSLSDFNVGESFKIDDIQK